MRNTQSDTKGLLPFFLISFAVSWILWTPSVLHARGTAVPDILLLFSQFALLGPALAAVILSRREEPNGIRGLFSSIWKWNFNPVWFLPTLLIPPLLAGLSLLIKLKVENQAFALGETFAPIPVFAVLLFFIGGPLEEIGWRGYALPRLLSRHCYVKAGLFLGLLHGIWHLPLHFISGTVQSAMPFWEFVAVTAVGSVIYSWIFIRTKGNLLLMLFHHWAGNFTAALLVYWDTSAGRWIFFALQLVFTAGVILYEQKRQRHVTPPSGDEIL